jgi:hypothetical protein
LEIFHLWQLLFGKNLFSIPLVCHGCLNNSFPDILRGYEKTNSEREPAKAPRADESTPSAQPTETRQEGNADTTGKTEHNADTAAADGEREPENPTEDTPRNKANKGEAERRDSTAATASAEEPGNRTRKRPNRTKRGRNATNKERGARQGTETRKRRPTRRTIQNEPGPKKAEAARPAKAQATE